MAKIVKRRRGSSADHASFTGSEGELTVDLTEKTVRVHDGVTQAGFPLARKDLKSVENCNKLKLVKRARKLLELEVAVGKIDFYVQIKFQSLIQNQVRVSVQKY